MQVAQVVKYGENLFYSRLEQDFLSAEGEDAESDQLENLDEEEKKGDESWEEEESEDENTGVNLFGAVLGQDAKRGCEHYNRRC